MTNHFERALAKPRTGVSPRTRLARVRERPRHRPAIRTLALPLTDTAALVVAAIVSGALAGPRCALYVASALAVLALSGQHRLRICLRVCDQIGRILTATTVPVLALLPWLHATSVPRLALLSATLVVTGRLAISAALRAAHRRGRLTERALIVGSGTFGAYLAELMRAHPEFGLRPQGFLDDGPPRLDLSLPSLGSPAALADVVSRLNISRVIVCFSSDCRDEDLVGLIRASRPLRSDVCVVPRLYELGMAVPRGCLDEIWGVPLIPLRRSAHAPALLGVKRAFDIVVALMLFMIAAPPLLALAIAIRLRSGQPALFQQARVTGKGRIVPVLKLRTVIAHDDHDTRWTTSAEHSSRLGRWLRATHMDELPQLINVIRGEMSLVGPRPERPYFAERFNRDIPRYHDRTRMPAGMTGWAQVNNLNGDTSIFERARFDNYYIEYWSVWLDIVILARTLAAVLRGGPRGTA